MNEKTNEVLSDEYDYTKYPAGLTGFTGLNPQQIVFGELRPATRVRVGWRGLYKSGLTQFPNGEILIATYSDIDSDRRPKIYFHHSKDGGLTWKQQIVSPMVLEEREPALNCLRDGTLLLQSVYGFHLFRSRDGGSTWQDIDLSKDFSVVLQYKAQGFNVTYPSSRNILEEQDGTLLSFASVGNDTCDSSTPRSKAWIFRSCDGGLTWPDYREITAWDRPEPMFGEASIVRLGNSHLLAAFRVEGGHVIGNTPAPRGLPYPAGDESGGHMLLMNSEDNGVHWTEPREFLNYSEVHGYLTMLKDGRILCTYANYHLPFGIEAILSNDQGKTWDKQHPIQLAVAADMWTGWPTSLQLPDGSIITSYARSAYLEHTAGMPLSDPNFSWNRRQDVVAEIVRWQLPDVVE